MEITSQTNNQILGILSHFYKSIKSIKVSTTEIEKEEAYNNITNMEPNKIHFKDILSLKIQKFDLNKQHILYK